MEWFPKDEPDLEDYIVPPPPEGYVPCPIADWYFALPRRNWFEFPEDTIVSNPLLLEDLRFSPTIANRIARGNFELPLQAFSFPPGFTFYQRNGTVQARMRGFLFSIPAGSMFELLEEFDCTKEGSDGSYLKAYWRAKPKEEAISIIGILRFLAGTGRYFSI
ncbi:hypothetical protein R1sor_022504 [Riccia sorocarpa]|uniref:Uncharacterized protein n=1 Tax=Riccia sorocarpa TaxID=122646 RepID=A0ABD3GK36_9MARC